MSSEQPIGLADLLLAEGLPGQPGRDAVGGVDHVAVGGADHQAVDVDRDRQLLGAGYSQVTSSDISRASWTALIASMAHECWPGSGPRLGGTPVEWYPGWVTLEPPPHDRRLSFQGVGSGEAARTHIVHFDVLVSDLASVHDRVVALGGVFIGEHVSPRPGPVGEQIPWRVYQDPAGHPFCLVVR